MKKPNHPLIVLTFLLLIIYSIFSCDTQKRTKTQKTPLNTSQTATLCPPPVIDALYFSDTRDTIYAEWSPVATAQYYLYDLLVIGINGDTLYQIIGDTISITSVAIPNDLPPQGGTIIFTISSYCEDKGLGPKSTPAEIPIDTEVASVATVYPRQPNGKRSPCPSGCDYFQYVSTYRKGGKTGDYYNRKKLCDCDKKYWLRNQKFRDCLGNPVSRPDSTEYCNTTE